MFPVFWACVNYPSPGLATWLVWRRRHVASVVRSRRLFVAQLILNAAFLPIVYRVKSRSVYVILDAVGLLLTMVTFRAYARVSRSAGYVIAPYAAWTGYTTLIKALWWRMGRC